MIYPLFIVLAALLWGFDGAILRPQLASLPVISVVFLSNAIAFIMMSPLLVIERKHLIQTPKKNYAFFLLISLFGGVLGSIFITKGLFYVNFAPLSVVILMQKLQPLFVILFAKLFLGEKFPRRFFLLATFAILGAYTITFPNLRPTFNPEDKTALAALFGLLAAFSWGVSVIFGKLMIANTHFRMATYVRYGFATFIALIFLLFSKSYQAIPSISSSQWLVITLISCLAIISILLYYSGLRHIQASTATICALALPISMIAFEFICYGRSINGTQMIGAALLLSSIIKISLTLKKS